MDDSIWEAARASRGWLDAANGTGQTELTCRILKLTEEAGEASAAWIGLLGQNPRKGVTHTREDVAAELATWPSPRWWPSRVWDSTRRRS
ncbi:MazG-like family protein [Micromonospora parastrephiae]|uniref:MazG-like family protein n=1 Tax=Micromonospora parastrephiae TaxID=2806101 RepID=UPI001EE4052B|nr:MazG-like family protein [Micromonospora parastrephiae]